MLELLKSLFDTGDFMSHANCYLWNRGLIRLHFYSDLAIGIAYLAISLTLLQLVRRAKTDIPFRWMFLAFGTFILSCGATHFMEVWTLWHPVYWLAGAVKLITAAASVTTALALPPLVPKSLALLNSAKLSDERRVSLELANAALEREVEARKRGEARIRELNADLETRVHAGMAELDEVSQRLISMAAIVECSDEAIIGLTLDQVIISWNPAAERDYGYAAEEILGLPLTILMPKGSPNQTSELIESVRQSKRVQSVETAHIRRNGELFYVLLTLSPLRNAAGDLYGVSYVAHDISVRKHAFEEVRRLNQELERRVAERTAELTAINTELEAFSYSVSHDLRAPLRQISGFSRILVEDFASELTPEACMYLQKIQYGARNMGQLVDDLLKLAKIGRQPLSRQLTPLNEVVESVVEEFKPECQDRQIEWRIGELSSAECDPRLMRQVFVNLLSNALKYTRRRSEAVIQIGQTIVDNEKAVFVQDNGAGFDMAYAGKLFGVFQRLHKSEDFEGTGVGLATTQRIIHKHGGRIWADAQPDKGATFFFTIPARVALGDQG